MLVALFIALPLSGQLQNSGTISGKIVDAQNSLVPEATVTITSVERGQALTVQSNERGEYIFPTVAVGHYELEVQAPLFKTFYARGVQIDADKNARIDVKLTVGEVSATVVVNAEDLQVDTQSATVGLLIDPDMVRDVPIDGQNIVALTALLPGVTSVYAPTTFTSDTAGPTYSANGARNTENLFLLDGALWNNLYYNTGLNFPPPDAIQEVSVLLNNFKAQYGRNSGSIFNVITRSGSKQFHGSLYDYMQNKAFNASDYIRKVNPKLVQNQFGGTISGPLLQNKLFFFGSFQKLKAQQTATAQGTTPTYQQKGLNPDGTPLPCSTTGFFAGQNCAAIGSYVANPLYLSSTPTAAQVANVGLATTALNAAYRQAGGTGTSPCVSKLLTLQSTASMGQEIPYYCINPVVQTLLTYLPVPNLSNSMALSQAPSPKNDTDGFIRADFNWNRHSLDARYYVTSVDDLLSKSTGATTGLATYEIDHDTGGIQFGDLGDTWIMRPNLLNVARVAYKRYLFDVMPKDQTTAADLGINLPSTTKYPVLPLINVSGYIFMGNSSMAYTHSINENFEFVDTLSWTHQNHNIQFGVDYLHVQYLYEFDSVPTFTFNNTYTSNVFGDFIFGLPLSEAVGNLTSRAGIQHALYMYGQDDWRLTPRLTLNLGLRYELPFPYFQPKNQNSTFIPGYQSTVFPQAPPNLAFAGDKGVGRSLVPSRYNNVAPRFGFAYDPFGKGRTSIRGGFGLFYSATNALVIGVGEPFHYSAFYSQPQGGISDPLLGDSPVPPAYDPKNPQFTTPYSIFYPDRDFKPGYTEAVNFGVQQAIRAKGVIAINYIGRFGHHQPIPIDKNPAIYDCSGAYFQLDPATYCTNANTTDASYRARVTYPNFNYGGNLIDYASIGSSNYHAAQILYTQRNMHGISIVSSFTYSKSIDEQSNGQTTGSSVPQPWNIRTQYSLSDFNSKLNLTLGWRLSPSKVRFKNRGLKILMNNWVASGSYTAQTGTPYNLTIPSDRALTAEPRQRPVLVPQFSGDNGSLPSHRHRLDKVNEWFNTSSFALPALGTYSSLRRNSLIGPAFIVNNVSAGRVFNFPIQRGVKLDFRADAFNVSNTPNLANPNSGYPSGACVSQPQTPGCSNFGKILGTNGSNNFVGTNGRRLQLSLKLIY